MKMHEVRTLYRGQWDELNLLNMRTGVLKFARSVFWRKILEDTHFVRFHAKHRSSPFIARFLPMCFEFELFA